MGACYVYIMSILCVAVSVWFNLMFTARNVDHDNTVYMHASVRLGANDHVVTSENVYLWSSRPKRAEFVRLVAIVSWTGDQVVVHVERHRAWSVGMFPATLHIGYIIKAEFDEGESMTKHVDSRFGRCDYILQWDYLSKSLCGKDSFLIDAKPIPCRVSIEISSVRYQYDFAWHDILLAASLLSVFILSIALPTIAFFMIRV